MLCGIMLHNYNYKLENINVLENDTIWELLYIINNQ